MNTLLKKMTFLSLMILSFCNPSVSNTVNEKKIDDDFLPNSIKNLIKDSLSEYSVPNENQFIDEWKSYDHISTPRFAFSDFNGDSKKDYAIILLSKNYKEILLVVFLSDNMHSFSIHRVNIFNLNENLIDVFISVEKKGYWQTSKGKINIKHDGICVDWASESISFSYYWKNNNFQKFLYD